MPYWSKLNSFRPCRLSGGKGGLSVTCARARARSCYGNTMLSRGRGLPSAAWWILGARRVRRGQAGRRTAHGHWLVRLRTVTPKAGYWLSLVSRWACHGGTGSRETAVSAPSGELRTRTSRSSQSEAHTAAESRSRLHGTTEAVAGRDQLLVSTCSEVRRWYAYFFSGLGPASSRFTNAGTESPIW